MSKSLGEIARDHYGTEGDEPAENTRKPSEEDIEYRQKYFAHLKEEKPEPKCIPSNHFVRLLKQRAAEQYDNYDWDVVNDYAIMLINYCINSDAFETQFGDLILNEPSLNKGILFTGGTGCGKSCLFEIFNYVCNRNNVPNRISGRLVSANTMAAEFSSGGHESIQKYFENGLLVDDLGSEGASVFYGERVEVLKLIIEERYQKHHRDGLKMHASTNLTPEQLEEKYGMRVRSRLREMFNIIHFKGEDLRK